MTLFIGIAGGSGSGKTTVAEKIASAVSGSTMLQHDSYYKDHADLSLDERNNLNFDHPDALDTALLIEHVKHLRAGNPIEVPIYDFKTHRRRVETITLEPAPVVIVEGILVLVEPKLRAELDIKIFVDTDDDIRLFRRIRRDMEERGRTFESIRAQYYETVRPMHLEYVAPCRRFADLIIPEGGDNNVAIDILVAHLRSV